MEFEINQELHESSLSRLKSKIEKSDCALISAYRKSEKDVTKKMNKGASDRLYLALKERGYSITKVIGGWIETNTKGEKVPVKEVSFFVQNINNDLNFKAEIYKLGVQFKQDSVLIMPKGKPAYVIGTSSDPEFDSPPKGVKEVLGHYEFGKMTSEFFTKIRGRPFEIKVGTLKECEIDDPRREIPTISGKFSLTMLAKRELIESERILVPQWLVNEIENDSHQEGWDD